MHLNEVRLIGNLGDDPEIKPCSNGATLFKCRVATGDEWHSVEFFADKEPVIAALRDRLAKGTLVYVGGEIATDTYIDKQGQKRIWKKIRARQLMALRDSLRGASTIEAEVGMSYDENPDVPHEAMIETPAYAPPPTPRAPPPQPYLSPQRDNTAARPAPRAPEPVRADGPPNHLFRNLQR